MLCRRSRHRGEPGIDRALQTGRSGAGGGRADRRDHLAILFADGDPRPRQGAGPRPCRGRGIGPRLSPDLADPIGHARICRCRRGYAACSDAALGRMARNGKSGIRGRPRPGTVDGRTRSRKDHGLAARAPSRQCDRHQRRRQFQRLAEPLSAISAAGAPARPDERRDGLRRAGGGGGEARRTPTGSSSASAATAAS